MLRWHQAILLRKKMHNILGNNLDAGSPEYGPKPFAYVSRQIY